MSRLNPEEYKWIDNIWKKIDNKMEITAERAKNKIPYFAKDGVYDDRSDDICWWTNGFWAGIMWILYCKTRKETYKHIAEISENKLDKAFEDYYGLHHDVGFMWMLSAGGNYKITGNEKSKKRCMHAANILAGRYNPSGEFIQAWNGNEHIGISIIDSMMNLSLLYWMSEEIGDPRYKNIAKKHADSVMKNHIRSDYSVNHIVKYDAETGDVIDDFGGQGYGKGSSWSRGQAWALYGFVVSYIHTKEERYLNTAKKCANYFIACVSDDWLPKADFRAPKEPVIYDSTAGACAACGLIELAGILDENEGRMYMDAAMNMLKTMEKKFCEWDPSYDSILQYGSESYAGCRHIPLIYGDYFFIEAISKLIDNKIFLW